MQDSLELMCCVLEQDTLSAGIDLVQPAEILLTGMKCINTNIQQNVGHLFKV